MLGTRKIQLSYRGGFAFGLFHPRAKPSFFQKELQAYRKLQKDYRRKNIIAYWERQTQIENEFIEKYDKQQEKKRVNDMLKFRTSVVAISYDTKRSIEREKKFLEKRSSTLEKTSLNEEMKKMNRRRILQLLELDSRDWYDIANIEKKMQDRIIIPDVVYAKTDYYLKLQEKAILYEAADYEGLEELEMDKTIVDYKNKQLVPLYTDIVSLVKHAKNDEVNNLLKEYHYAQAQLFKKYKKGSEQYNIHLKRISEAYVLLLSKYYSESAKPKRKIEILSKKMLILYNLLTKWESYIGLVKASGEVMTSIMEMEKDEEQNENEEEKDKELKEGEQQSAEEEATSGSEDDKEMDLEQEELDDQKEQKIMQDSALELKSELKAKKKEAKKQEQEEDPMEKILAELFHKIEKNDVEKLEKEYDQIYIKDNRAVMYEEKEKKELKDSLEFLKIEKLDVMFPKNIMNQIQDFSTPKLDFQTIAQIKAHEDDPGAGYDEERENLGRYDLLQTSTLIEIYKKELEELRESEGLSTKEKKRIDEVIYLANLIGQKKVDEPRMLLKVWERYNA